MLADLAACDYHLVSGGVQGAFLGGPRPPPGPRLLDYSHKIEHRLFCHITQNWRGKPLRTFETVVDLIGNTRTAAGLRVEAGLDAGEYPTGEKVTKAEMDALSLHRDEFHGDWNYELRPR